MKAPGPAARRTVVALLVGGLLIVVGLVAIGSFSTPLAADEDAPTEPGLNAITIVVDDMNDFSCREAHLYLPRSSGWLRDQGRCFENATGTTPVCCPARAEIFTGQLPHNNGVERQVDARLFPTADSIQQDLGDAGLTTYAAGKLFNGVKAGDYVTGGMDPGFDRIEVWNNYDYDDYELVDEDGVSYEPEEQIHTTVRTGQSLRGFVSEMADAGTPFFAYAGFFAPHTQSQRRAGTKLPEATPANADRPVPPLRLRSERDTRDKLALFRRLDMSPAELRALHRARVRALYDVDDEIAATFELLEATGLIERTAVFFVSDNGYSLGQNGWEAKAVPYVGSRSVPMFAYLPAVFGAGVVDSRPVGLVDVAPTLYDLYDLQPGHIVDGHSLAGRYRRTVQYHEFRNEQNDFVLQESGFEPFRVPTWRMVVTAGGRSYIEYYDRHGRRIHQELYDDAAQQRNLLHPAHRRQRPPASVVARLRAQLVQLRQCEGTTEQGSPRPCP